MISYVLLISVAVILSVVAYQWMKTYIPKDIPECPDDVAISIENSDCLSGQLVLTIRNPGLFNIDGVIVEATTQENKIISLFKVGEEENVDFISLSNMAPNAPSSTINLKCPSESETICTSPVQFVEITPVRYQEDEKGKTTIVNCGKAKIKEIITSGCQLSI